jgi:multisubunit Na+/H+ antiporter MnhE subunit
MADVSGNDSESKRETHSGASLMRRAAVWLVWWALLMSLWVIQDDSLQADELLAGAGAAAIAATLAELAGYQASTRLRMRVEWLGPAFRLPGGLVRDTAVVFAALWRQIVRGQPPNSGFREVPVRFGGQSIEDKSRRALLVGGNSVAPNTFALGLDRGREVMVVHHLVLPEEGE